jgi:hypothetical protein
VFIFPLSALRAGPLGPSSLFGASFGAPGEKLCFSWG